MACGCKLPLVNRNRFLTSGGHPRVPMPITRPKKERKSQVSEPAGADNEPPLDFSGTDPATFEPYDKRSETEKASGDWQALEKAAGQMIIKR